MYLHIQIRQAVPLTLNVGSSFWNRVRAFMKAGIVPLSRGVRARLITASGTLMEVMASLGYTHIINMNVCIVQCCIMLAAWLIPLYFLQRCVCMLVWKYITLLSLMGNDY